MEEVPRRTSLVPLACPCFVLRLIGVETEALLDYQGRAGDHFRCTVEPSPGHIRCRNDQHREVKTGGGAYHQTDKYYITMGPKMITHIFIVWEFMSRLHRTSVTHGFLARILLCDSGAYEGTFCQRANCTH